MNLVVNNDDRLFLRLPAEPQNVALVRQAVGSEAVALGMQGRGIEDLKTVISEACANVVLHAYPGDADQRPLEVELAREGDALEAIVRDCGQGIQPRRAEVKPPSLRLGLLLIGAMASCLQLHSARGRGTELLVRFPLSAA